MKRSIIIIFLILFSLTNCQDKNTFDIQEVLIEKKFSKRKKSNSTEKETFFYEDKEYLVTKTCRGEWGGSIWFKNKKTGIIYSCESTCPKSINKIDNKYIVTNSLAHMSGSSEIIQIENPNQLNIFEKPEPRKGKNGIEFNYPDETESKSRKGVKILWSQSEILTYLSFINNKKLYHIMVKNGKTYLTTLENDKLVLVDLISEKRIWSHHTEHKISKDHTLLYLGRDFQKNEYIEIKGNKIKLVRYK